MMADTSTAAGVGEVQWPRYVDGMWVNADTLSREQAARLDELRRHVWLVHGSGNGGPGAVLWGLEVDTGIDTVVVRPGYGVTASGGLVRLESPATVRLDEAAIADGALADIVIVGRDAERGAVAVRAGVPGGSPAPPGVASAEIALCRVTRNAGAGPTVVWSHTLVVAASLTHPSGRSRVTLGPTSGHPSRALTVELGEPGALRPVTTVDTNGATQVAASGRLRGPLRPAGALHWAGPGRPPPKEAAPWSLYRVASVPAQPPNQPGASGQLRAELGEIRSGTGAASRVFAVVQLSPAVGSPAAVTTSLSVDAAGTVTVSGSLVVEGEVTVVGGAAAGTAKRLAQQIALLRADAAQLLNPAAGDDLKIQAFTATIAGSKLTTKYNLFCVASGRLVEVAAYQTVVAGSQRLWAGFAAEAVTLAGGASKSVTQEVDVSSVPKGGLVQIDVVAIGRSTAVGPPIGLRSSAATKTVTKP